LLLYRTLKRRRDADRHHEACNPSEQMRKYVFLISINISLTGTAGRV